MNILYINHYAGSPEYGMEYRPYYMAREWVQAGNNVRILAANFSHVRAKQPINGKFENISGIEYVWYKTSRYAGNGVARVKNIFAFLWQVWRDRKSIVNDFKPNVVIASSTYPLDIFVARKIAKQAKAKLIFEVHDLWPLSPIELGGMSPKHPFIMLCQYAENVAYSSSDAVVSMLPKVHEHMSAHGLDLNKLVIIPNGIVEDDWQDESIDVLQQGRLLDFIINQKNDGKLIVCYAGSHGKPNALEYLLDAAKMLEDKEIIFILVGSGLEKESLKQKKTKEMITNIFFFDPIPKQQIPSLLKLVDIAYIGLLSQPLFRFGISPNKLIDYMMAKKAILCAINAGNDPVTEQNCGITVEPDNIAQIADTILFMSQLSMQDREKMGLNGHNYALKNHSYTVLANKFLEEMKK